MREGGVLKVRYVDENGNPNYFIKGRPATGVEGLIMDVVDIQIYRAQGEGDKGYIRVVFSDTSSIELNNFEEVHFAPTKES